MLPGILENPNIVDQLKQHHKNKSLETINIMKEKMWDCLTTSELDPVEACYLFKETAPFYEGMTDSGIGQLCSYCLENFPLKRLR
jgi:hypothetical protein